MLTAMDLSAAFDTVDHDILLKVLKINFHVENTALQWFDTYLRPRNMVVNVNQAYSAPRDLPFSVPQSSCLGPTLYSVYASTMKDIIPERVKIHGYADDHAIKKEFTPEKEENNTKDELETCLVEIKKWMDQNRLKMNDAKTEFILFGSRKMLAKCESGNIDCNGAVVKRSKCIRYLGADLDENMNMKVHISRKCRTAWVNLQRIKLIRKFLTQEATEVLINGLITSHLDYANSLLYGLPKCEIKKLERVQKCSAKIILKRGYMESATKALKDLHWLPVKLRIEFKINCITHKCVNGIAPVYLSDLIIKKKLYRSGLRSGATGDIDLHVDFNKRKTFADRAFSHSAPLLWNKLPRALHEIDNHDQFKSKLKTHLFNLY